MRIRSLIAIAVTSLVLAAPAVFAQFSKSTIQSQITTQFPDNTTGQITPATTRTFLNNLATSYQQYAGLNKQVGTTYTVQASDYGQLVTFNNSSTVNVSLSPANATGFSTFNFYAQNISSGNVVITPVGSTICGASSLTLNNLTSAWIISDGTNYQCLYGLAVNIPNGNSGGIPYYNTSTTLASSAALAANDIIVGGGAGNPPVTGNGCTLTSSTLVCSGVSTSSPQLNMSAAANDATSAVIVFQKSRGANPVTTSDSIFDLQSQGFQSGNFRASGRQQYIVTGLSGTNVASKWVNSTSSLSSVLGNLLTMDAAGHLFTTIPSPPTTTNCGTTPSISSGSTDNAGSVVAGTGTPTACVIQFASAWTAAPKCIVGTSPSNPVFSYTMNTTVLTVAQAATSSNTITWHCGLGNG